MVIKLLVSISKKSKKTQNNEVNDESETFKTAMLKSSLYDYSDAYIPVKGIITVNNKGTALAPNNRNRKVTFKNCAPFTNFISEIKNTQVDNAKNIDIVIQMYNLIEYSHHKSKTSGSL